MVTATEPFSVTDSYPVFTFGSTGDDNWPVWDRFIDVGANRTFAIGNVCGSCDFLFKRLATAVDKPEMPAKISALLNAGFSRLEEIPIPILARILPGGRYRALLQSRVPQFVTPGDSNDYFAHEQMSLRKFPRGPTEEEPHDPVTGYYRLGSFDMGEGRGLFEFAVPTTPVERLDRSRIDSYRSDGDGGGTVLAVSTLDVKAPTMYEGDPAIHEHWCLTHYVLDGNHKLHASSLAARPVSILSFLAIDKGVSNDESIAELVRYLTGEALRPL